MAIANENLGGLEGPQVLRIQSFSAACTPEMDFPKAELVRPTGNQYRKSDFARKFVKNFRDPAPVPPAIA